MSKPEEPKENRDLSDYVAIWETSDSAVLPVIESLLDSAEIPYVVLGEEALGMLPMGGVGGIHATFGKGIAAKILVPKERREEAETLIHASPHHPG